MRSIRQRGSVQLGYILLGFGVVLAAALLASVHKAFAWLLPVGILIFLWPSLVGLWAHWRARFGLERPLTQARRDGSGTIVVLRNRHGGVEAQAVWIDVAHGELGFVSGDGDSAVKALSALRRVHPISAEATYASSFHRGRVRIPPRYGLAFEFEDGTALELWTFKQRRVKAWCTALRQPLAKPLEVSVLSEDC